jgi:hypothetical protein
MLSQLNPGLTLREDKLHLESEPQKELRNAGEEEKPGGGVRSDVTIITLLF